MVDSHKIDKLVRYIADDPIYQIHEFNIDLKANHLYLMGNESYIGSNADDPDQEPGVEYSMSNYFIKNLNILMRKSNNPILVHMKTCGGDWKEGMAIYDAIKACPNFVTILNYTHARSMSSIIFQAADKRVMMPNSTFMFHDGTITFDGTVKQFFTEYEQNKIAEGVMYNIYIDAMKDNGRMSNQPRSKIKRWLKDQINKKEDVYFSAEQSVEYGFADQIFGQDGQYDWKKLIEE